MDLAVADWNFWDSVERDSCTKTWPSLSLMISACQAAQSIQGQIRYGMPSASDAARSIDPTGEPWSRHRIAVWYRRHRALVTPPGYDADVPAAEDPQREPIRGRLADGHPSHQTNNVDADKRRCTYPGQEVVRPASLSGRTGTVIAARSSPAPGPAANEDTPSPCPEGSCGKPAALHGARRVREADRGTDPAAVPRPRADFH